MVLFRMSTCFEYQETKTEKNGLISLANETYNYKPIYKPIKFPIVATLIELLPRRLEPLTLIYVIQRLSRL